MIVTTWKRCPKQCRELRDYAAESNLLQSKYFGNHSFFFPQGGNWHRCRWLGALNSSGQVPAQMGAARCQRGSRAGSQGQTSARCNWSKAGLQNSPMTSRWIGRRKKKKKPSRLKSYFTVLALQYVFTDSSGCSFVFRRWWLKMCDSSEIQSVGTTLKTMYNICWLA